MCLFFEVNNCCPPARPCCLNRGSWNRTTNCCCRFNNIRQSVPGTTINNISAVRKIAQFTAPGSTLAVGDNILFGSTVFNNSAGDITLGGGGLVTLLPGTYQIDYFATVSNASEDAVVANLGLTVNGGVNSPSQSTSTVAGNGTQTLSGSTVIFVQSGNVANIQLTNLGTADEELTLVRANLIITKVL